MSKKPPAPEPPDALSPSARTLWAAIHDEFVLTAAEVAVLTTACRQQTDIDALEALLAEQGGTVVGSAGQPRLNPIYSELRQGRLALGKLLGELALPDDDGKPQTAASKRAQKAARLRWDRAEAARIGKAG